MKTLTLVLLMLITALATACTVEESQTEALDTVQLVDPCTYAPIGIKDLTTGTYHFDDGSEYAADAVLVADLPDDVCAKARTTSAPPLLSRKEFIVLGSSCHGSCDVTKCFQDCSTMTIARIKPEIFDCFPAR